MGRSNRSTFLEEKVNGQAFMSFRNCQAGTSQGAVPQAQASSQAPSLALSTSGPIEVEHQLPGLEETPRR